MSPKLLPGHAMILDPTEIAGLLPFDDRYDRRRLRWLDGPHESWEAFDRVMEREVILNVAWGYTDASRFIRAAKISGSLRHPGILPVHDLGILGGSTPFYTTPPVPEKPLGHLLREFQDGGPPSRAGFPILALVGALRDACRALEHAHRRGHLHLDLHPDCLLIGGDDHVVLDINDWRGVGGPAGGEAGEAILMGRPAYMSPEQVAGAVVGPQADVFGLGGLLHVILFGTPPNHLPGRPCPLEVLRAIAGRAFEPRQPGTLRPEIRRATRRGIDGLVAICLKALAHVPGRRYPTAAEMGDAMERWLTSRRGAWWEVFLRRRILAITSPRGQDVG